MNTLTSFGGISVNDLDKAKDFYVNTLGLELDNEKMGLTFKLPGGGTIFIYPKENHQPATYTALNFVVPDIDSAVDELTAKGVKFEIYETLFPGAPAQDNKGILRTEDPGDGPSIAWFKDPAGNTLAVLNS
jgi:catechol 2,3-dioxygenase-like lactoylglutathione lyase family enzyme